MEITGQATELRIYIGESDHHKGRPLFQAIVQFMKEQGLAGATVMRGIEGFGANSRIHTANILRLSEDLPLVIVTVDSRDRIDRVLPALKEMISEGLVTIHDVEVIKYTHSQRPETAGGRPGDDADRGELTDR